MKRCHLSLFPLLLCILLLSGCGNSETSSDIPSATFSLPESADEMPSEYKPELSPEPLPVYDLNFTISGQTLSADVTTLNLTQATPEEIDALIKVLPALTSLQSLELGYADAFSPLISWEQVQELRQVAPAVALYYEVSFPGYRFSLDDDILNLNHIRFMDDGKLAMQIASCMPNLRIIDMDSCGVPDESMAAIRDTFPDVEVVWRVFFGDAYSTRTDADRLMISNPERGFKVLDGDAMKGLYYCTKLKYLDLGHLSSLNDVGFVANMPDLEVLIIAMTAIKDLSALAECPKLNYLEVQNTAACDLSPLAGLKQLKDLNICYNFALRDMAPIMGLDLDRLWIGSLTPISHAQIEEYQSRHPDCWVNTTTENPTEEEWRVLEDGTAAPRYTLLYDEFQYMNFPQCYAYNENDHLYWSRFDYPVY